MAADRAGKVWFITGTSSEFGRHWLQSALRRGDRVAVTARALSSLEPLVQEYGELILPLRLDITDRVAAANALLLGAGALEVMTTEHEQRLTTWQRGEEFACPRLAKPALSSRR